MPHFCRVVEPDCKGKMVRCSGEEVVCQICGRVKCCLDVRWMTPVPGKMFNGNVCVGCIEG
jgi:hypothetical protein